MEEDDEVEKEKKKQITEEVVEFLKKRSDHDSPRYCARLRSYADLCQKLVHFLALIQVYLVLAVASDFVRAFRRLRLS